MNISDLRFGMMIQRQLGMTQRSLARAMERLASGQRINSARDDAAGLAMTSRLDAQIRSAKQASRNINEVYGLLTTAEGVMSEQANMVQRMRELAIQAANGTLSDADRGYLNRELQTLLAEFDRLSSQTQFNGVNLLDGSFGSKSLQVGPSGREKITISLASMRTTAVFTETTNVGDGTFQPRTTLATGTGPSKVVVTDMNGDGNLDLLSSDATAGTISIRLGNGDATFKARTTIAVGSLPWGLITPDINNDGILDIVVGDRNDNTLSVALGNGNGTFRTRTTMTTGTTPRDVQSADFNEDGNIDLISSDVGGSSVSLFFGNGNGTFQARTTLATAAGPGNSTVADLNGDGNLDLVVTENSAYTIGVFLGNGNGTFQARTALTPGGGPVGPTTGDVNGDGKLDIVVADLNDSTASIFLGNGNGTFQTRTTVATGTSPNGFAVLADFNGDERLDIITSDYGSVTSSILLGNGNGTFRTRTTLTLGAGPICVAAADLDDDGALELIGLSNGESTLSIYVGNGNPESTSASVDISTQSNAKDMLDVFDNAFAYIAEARSEIGATQSRLTYADSLNSNATQNLSAARSQLSDADYATEVAEVIRLQALQQAGLRVLSQSHSNLRLIVELLQQVPFGTGSNHS